MGRRIGRAWGVGLAVLIAGIGSSCSDSGGKGGRGSVSSGSGATATVTNTVASPAEMAVGDIFQILFAGGEQGAINLSGASSQAKYVLAVANLGTSAQPAQVQISGDSSVAPALAKAAVVGIDETPAWEEPSLQESFDQQLRNWELALSAESLAPIASTHAKAAVTPPAIGDREAFRVIAGISKLTEYVEVTAELRCIGTKVLFYVDREVLTQTNPELTQTDVDQACARFDLQVAESEQLLGTAPDVNGDGRVAVLFTPQVNRLGASGGGIVTGFFFANDLHPRSDSNAVSNMREILYLLVPDSAGQYGYAVNHELAVTNLIPAVLPHELQHAISYNQHVLAGGGLPEESWLNEGVSHLMEDVLGIGLENPSRYALYLQQTASYGLVSPGSPGLVARGGIFLFLRYLYEQAADGAQFLSALLQSDQTGVGNIEAAFAATDPGFDQYSEFVLRWAAMLVLNNTGLTSDPRFNYHARTWDVATGQFSGVCTHCEAEDYRGTEIAGVTLTPYLNNSTATLAAGAVRFYEIAGPHEAIKLWSAKGGSYGAVLVRTQ